MDPHYLVAIYAGLTFFGSLAGGWIPLLRWMNHTRMQITMSGVAGLMLGMGVFHMLPHAAAELRLAPAGGAGPLDRAVWWMMIGLLVTFFLQRFFHFHQHEAPLAADDHAACDHDHSHGNEHAPQQPAAAGHGHNAHPLNWVGMCLGLLVHTIMDGVALASSVEAEARLHHGALLPGLGIFLAVFLHKPLDAMAITALMRNSGWSPAARHTVNALFALVCPLGAGLFYLTLGQTADYQHLLVGCALAFSAGTFLCISLSDLLPEIQFHSHDRIKLSLALLLGVSLAYGIMFLEESGHDHGHGHSPGSGHDHGHEHAHDHAHE